MAGRDGTAMRSDVDLAQVRGGGHGAWKIFALALALRLAYVLLYPQYPLGSDDAFGYDRLGWNLALGKGFIAPYPGAPEGSLEVPEVGVGPIYPGFLALIYFIFGHQLDAVRIIQAFISAAVVLVLFPRIKEAFGAETAKLACVLIALYPAFIIYTGVLLTETLTSFFLAVLVWALAAGVRACSRWAWAFGGLVMGITVLHRQETLAMVPVFAGLIAWKAGERRVRAGVAIFLVIALATAGLWTARNYLVFQRFIPVTDHGGVTLWISTKGWIEFDLHDPEYQSLLRVKYYEQNGVFFRAGIRNIVNDPANYTILCLKRLYHLWIGSHSTYVTGLSRSFKEYYLAGALGRVAVKALMLVLNTCLVLLGIGGAIVALRLPRGPPGLKGLFLVPVAVIAVIHVFLFATPRYTVAIMPFVLVFVAVTLEHARRVLNRQARPLMAAAAGRAPA